MGPFIDWSTVIDHTKVIDHPSGFFGLAGTLQRDDFFKSHRHCRYKASGGVYTIVVFLTLTTEELPRRIEALVGKTNEEEEFYLLRYY